ncbi:acyl carrier protein [Streptomyces sp. NPDC046876]|uniref:acyl carrier protein n=1 Tax=Streptomyces sp. NPDC046876 TaxID=3155616 RepID=UPI0033DCC945
MSSVRALLREITGLTALVDRLDAEADLITSGVDSGDLIRLVVRLEEERGAEISAEELDGLTTIAAFERLLHTGGAAAAYGEATA